MTLTPHTHKRTTHTALKQWTNEQSFRQKLLHCHLHTSPILDLWQLCGSMQHLKSPHIAASNKISVVHFHITPLTLLLFTDCGFTISQSTPILFCKRKTHTPLYFHKHINLRATHIHSHTLLYKALWHAMETNASFGLNINMYNKNTNTKRHGYKFNFRHSLSGGQM